MPTMGNQGHGKLKMAPIQLLMSWAKETSALAASPIPGIGTSATNHEGILKWSYPMRQDCPFEFPRLKNHVFKKPRRNSLIFHILNPFLGHTSEALEARQTLYTAQKLASLWARPQVVCLPYLVSGWGTICYYHRLLFPTFGLILTAFC